VRREIAATDVEPTTHAGDSSTVHAAATDGSDTLDRRA
jgi:hypothetical protein